VLIRGGSCIISPLGEVLAGPVFDQPAILTAEVDLDAISRGTFDLDVVGHYARPDLFQLTVNTAPARAVRFIDDEEIFVEEDAPIAGPAEFAKLCAEQQLCANDKAGDADGGDEQDRH
jgi:hypothetical protein